MQSKLVCLTLEPSAFLGITLQLHTGVQLDLDFARNQESRNGWRRGQGVVLIKIILSFKEGIVLYCMYTDHRQKHIPTNTLWRPYLSVVYALYHDSQKWGSFLFLGRRLPACPPLNPLIHCCAAYRTRLLHIFSFELPTALTYSCW